MNVTRVFPQGPPLQSQGCYHDEEGLKTAASLRSHKWANKYTCSYNGSVTTPRGAVPLGRASQAKTNGRRRIEGRTFLLLLPRLRRRAQFTRHPLRLPLRMNSSFLQERKQTCRAAFESRNKQCSTVLHWISAEQTGRRRNWKKDPPAVFCFTHISTGIGNAAPGPGGYTDAFLLAHGKQKNAVASTGRIAISKMAASLGRGGEGRERTRRPLLLPPPRTLVRAGACGQMTFVEPRDSCVNRCDGCLP